MANALIKAIGLLWMGWALAAGAHPLPESVVWIDSTPAGMTLTAQLPLNRLEFAFGQPLAARPELVLAQHGDALAAYLLKHVGARSAAGSWQVLRPHLTLRDSGGSPELQAVFSLRAPAGAEPDAPVLLYDVITHEVRTHRVQVFLRNDWNAGFAGQTPLPLGELNSGQVSLPVPLGQHGAGNSLLTLFIDGIVHIAEGSDHLLFLLMLLLAAPLAARDGQWAAMRPVRQTVAHLGWVISAFTLGHSLTLVVGSLGWVPVPAQTVEVAVALTIVVTAVHAWRPVFGHGEAWMALAFGLVHGMAFSASLSSAGLTPAQHAQALLAFNLGIEAMQLAAVAVALPALLVLAKARPAWYAPVRRTLALLGAGLATLWVMERTGLLDPGYAGWLGDAALPAALVALLWLGSLAAWRIRG